jgi:hypothetical protein
MSLSPIRALGHPSKTLSEQGFVRSEAWSNDVFGSRAETGLEGARMALIGPRTQGIAQQ